MGPNYTKLLTFTCVLFLDVVQLFQFFSRRNRDHFYTYNQQEAGRRYRLKRDENVACRILRSSLPEGTRPLYRYFDGTHRRRRRPLNDHFMTTSEAEVRSKYFIGPFYAGPKLTLAPLTPVLITPLPNFGLTSIRAGNNF